MDRRSRDDIKKNDVIQYHVAGIYHFQIWMFELSKCHFRKISLRNYYVECLVSAQSATHLILSIYIICLGKTSGRIRKPALLGLFFWVGTQILNHPFKEGWPNRDFGHVKWRSKTSVIGVPSPSRNFALRWLVPPIRPCFLGWWHCGGALRFPWRKINGFHRVEFIHMKIMFSKNSGCFCRWFKENSTCLFRNMWGLPHVTEIYLGETNRGSTLVLETYQSKLDILSYIGVSIKNVWKPPSTCTLAHKHRDTRTQTHTSIYTRVCPSRHCWNLRYQNSWWLVTWTWFMWIQVSSRQIWANSQMINHLS